MARGIHLLAHLLHCPLISLLQVLALPLPHSARFPHSPRAAAILTVRNLKGHQDQRPSPAASRSSRQRHNGRFPAQEEYLQCAASSKRRQLSLPVLSQPRRQQRSQPGQPAQADRPPGEKPSTRELKLSSVMATFKGLTSQGFGV